MAPYISRQCTSDPFTPSFPPSLRFFLPPSLQEKLEDSGSGSAVSAVLALPAQDQAPTSGMAPRGHAPLAAGKNHKANSFAFVG